MTKIQRKALHTSSALLLIGSVYILIFRTPIYRLDALSLTIVILLTVGFIGIVWSSSE